MRQMGVFGRLLVVLGGTGSLIAMMAGAAAAAPGSTATAQAGAAAQAGATTAAGAIAGRAAAPDFGNPAGHFYVPPAGRAVNTSHPNRVIGTGTAASCTSAAVVRAVAKGGIITFRCGPKPLTIVMTQTASVSKTRHLVVLDGGGLITLSGGGKRRILYSDTCAGTWSTDDCVNQPYPRIVVQNITFTDGYASARQATCTANEPQCWYGGVDGGGAIYVEGGQFKAVNSRFLSNRCYSYGPDLGGGAIRALAQFRNRPVYITSDTFRGGRCSNGGALSSIDVNWDVINSVMTGNKAIGWGANPASPGTLGGGSGGAIYTDGDNYNVLIAGTVIRRNTAREGGGAVFFVVDNNKGTLTIKSSTLHNNPSGEFFTAGFPGIFFHSSGHPILIDSTIS